MLSGNKISASRAKKQVSTSERNPPPNFKLRSRLKVLQAERKSKFQRVNVIEKLTFLIAERRREIQASVATTEALLHKGVLLAAL